MTSAFLLDVLFPRRSLTGEEGAWITEEELRHLTAHPQTYDAEGCRVIGLPGLDALIAVSTYRDCPLLRKALHTFKFRRLPTLGVYLGSLMAERFAGHVFSKEEWHLCPVPLHWSRRFYRGFNQADILAREISRRTGLPVACCLVRSRATGHQSHRTRCERMMALEGAFRCHGNTAPARILLIDDVCTTGATLRECAAVLRRAGTSCIVAVVCAHDAARH